jgi:hypothetical protein
MANKPVLHRRDHEHGGADTVRIVYETVGGDGEGGGFVIQDEGVPLPPRAALNFIGDAVTATDDEANNRTNVEISGDGGGGGGGVGGFLVANADYLGSGAGGSDFGWSGFTVNTLGATIDTTQNVVVVAAGWYLMNAQVNYTGGGEGLLQARLFGHGTFGWSSDINYIGTLIEAQSDATGLGGQFCASLVYLTHLYGPGVSGFDGSVGVTFRLHTPSDPSAITSATLGLVQLHAD